MVENLLASFVTSNVWNVIRINQAITCLVYGGTSTKMADLSWLIDLWAGRLFGCSFDTVIRSALLRFPSAPKFPFHLSSNDRKLATCFWQSGIQLHIYKEYDSSVIDTVLREKCLSVWLSIIIYHFVVVFRWHVQRGLFTVSNY